MAALPKLLLAVFLYLGGTAGTSAASLTSQYASVVTYHGALSPASAPRRTASRVGRRRTPLLLCSVGAWHGRRHGGGAVAATGASGRRRRLPSRRGDELDDLFGGSAVHSAADFDRAITYQDLSPFGKAVAGTVEVCVATALEYARSFLGAYALGVFTDVPRLLFRAAERDAGAAADQAVRPLLQEINARLARMNGKSLRWARSWGEISAVFAASGVAVRVLRDGREDEWSTVLSSMAAGAFFGRKQGPQGMIRGAATYGMLMYLLSGKAFRRNKGPFHYDEVPAEF